MSYVIASCKPSVVRNLGIDGIIFLDKSLEEYTTDIKNIHISNSYAEARNSIDSSNHDFVVSIKVAMKILEKLGEQEE